VRVDRVANVVLSAAGYGYATITAPQGVTWRVDLTSISTTVSPTAGGTQPVCTLYLDSAPNAGRFLEGTWSGNRDTSDSKYVLHGGQAVTAEWMNGTAGSTATVRITGEQTEGG
jgi:hypothetical protein